MIAESAGNTLYSDIQNLIFDPCEEKAIKIGSLTITHDREKDPCLQLAHTILFGNSLRVGCNDNHTAAWMDCSKFNYKEGHQRIPDTLNHQHYSLEKLKQKYQFALLNDKAEMASFMVLTTIMGDMILNCHKRLNLEISLAQNHLELLRQTVNSPEFRQQEQELQRELKDFESEKDKFLEDWSEKLGKATKKVSPIRKEAKKAEAVKTIVNTGSKAYEPLQTKEDDMQRRLKTFENKILEIQRIEDVIKIARKEVESHAEIAEFLKTVTDANLKDITTSGKDKEESV